MTTTERLQSLYYDTAEKTAFSGGTPILHATKGFIPEKDVNAWLQRQDAYTLHRPVRRKFPRLHYNVTNIDDVFEADLCDMQALKSYNDGYTFLLVVIDVLSKYVFVEPLKNKTSKAVATAFEKILQSTNRKPVQLQTDQGKEFVGEAFQQLLRKHDIRFRVARSPDVKASIAERFNRTLKNRIWRYFTFKNSKRYIDVLQDIVKGYNNTVHSSIKMTPASVTLENARVALQNIRNKYKSITRLPKYSVGQHVRISRSKHVFEKGYYAGYTEEIFKITKVLGHRKPPVYILTDWQGTEIDGIFYEEELSPVIIEADTTYQIDKILKTAGSGRHKKYLVSWKGYPASFNSWILATQLQDINDTR